MPANVNSFLQVLVPVVQFDILDSSWTTEYIFEFDEDYLEETSKGIPDQTKNLGYETHNAVLNLGSIGIFSFLYYAKFAFLLAPLKLLRKYKLCDSLLTKLVSSMIFSEILELNFDGYLEIIIAGVLDWQDNSSSRSNSRSLSAYDISNMTSGEIASNAIGGYSMLLSGLMPILSLWVAFQSNEYLSSPDFKQKYGAFTHQVAF